MKEDHPEENQGFFKKLGNRVFKKNRTKGYDTETEIKNMVSEGHEKGEIEKTEAEMINNIFEFAEKEANDVMVHRTGISAIEANSTIGEAFERTMQDGFSRYPVYIDDLDQIIGIFHIRDLVKVYAIEENRDKTLLELRNKVLIDAYIIPETRNISQLLKEMQLKKSHMAIVVDEYGQTAGLVTMEDILEEIVGDFTTSNAPTIDEEVVQQSDGSMIIEGSANLRDLNKMFNWNLDTEDARTFNGLILEHLEEIPEEGTVCEVNGLRVTILEVSDNMIKQAKVVKL